MFKHLGYGVESLFPGAIRPGTGSAEIVDEGRGQYVSRWDEAKLGPMPSLDVLEAAGVAYLKKLDDDAKANTDERTSLRAMIQDETEAAWLARTDAARWRVVLRALKAIEKRI